MSCLFPDLFSMSKNIPKLLGLRGRWEQGVSVTCIQSKPQEILSLFSTTHNEAPLGVKVSIVFLFPGGFFFELKDISVTFPFSWKMSNYNVSFLFHHTNKSFRDIGN